MDPVWTILGGVVVAVAAAWAGAFFARRRTESQTNESNANAAATVTDTAMSLLEPLRARIQILEQENQSQTLRLDRQSAEVAQLRMVSAACHRRMDELSIHIVELEDMLRDAGVKPPPRPDDYVIDNEGDNE